MLQVSALVSAVFTLDEGASGRVRSSAGYHSLEISSREATIRELHMVLECHGRQASSAKLGEGARSGGRHVIVLQ